MRSRTMPVLAALAALLLAGASPAVADHTDPGAPLSPVEPQQGEPVLTSGSGTWRFLANLGPMQGTDLEFFFRGKTTYVSAGTLGQAPAGTPAFVGQRIVQLTDSRGTVLESPKVVADHGSARCTINTSATGLQHDVQAIPRQDTQLLIDTTDAVGRCHDTASGGLEILDVSGLGTPGFQVREIGLVRLNGLSHTVTADVTRPGILYNNGGDFGTGTGPTATGMPWIDVVDVRSCLGLAGRSLAQKRAACRPTVTRFPFKPEWSSKKSGDGSLSEPANCHDTTAAPGRIYCAALNATLVLDVTGLLDATGKVRGKPLPCTVVDGTTTGAKVTNCVLVPKAGVAPNSSVNNPTAVEAATAYKEAGSPAATGIRFLGSVNHPGRACGSPAVTNCNTNTEVRADVDVAVSHESDPTPDGKYMFVTDERGGGVIPPGSTCAPSLDNPIGNGGMHVFDIRNPAKIVHAKTPAGQPAVYIGESPTPSPTFCTIHVIEQLPGEARISAGYYDGGTKLIDYAVDAKGAWTFKEVAAFRLPGANTWASEVFKTVDNPDGTRTYYFVSTSFALGEGTARGIDVFSWTGKPNLLKAAARPAAGSSGSGGGQAPPAPAPRSLPTTGPDRLVGLVALVLLPLAVAVRVVRRRTTG